VHEEVVKGGLIGLSIERLELMSGKSDEAFLVKKDFQRLATQN
jgi:hypothetical protein